MKCVYLLLLSLCASSLGFEIATRIFQGTNAKLGEIPYIVSVQSNGKHKCGGVILAKDLIVTAAHCVGGDINQYSIVAGTVNINVLDAGYQRRKFASRCIHPKYKQGDNETIQYDIALAKLCTPLTLNKNINSIEIIKEADLQTAIKKGNKGLIAGWGQDENDSSVKILKRAYVPLLPEEECLKQNNPKCHDYSKERNLCTGPLGLPRSGVGQLDDGGPLAVDKQLAGIILHGLHEEDEDDHDHDHDILCHTTSVYTKINYYIEFIRNQCKK